MGLSFPSCLELGAEGNEKQGVKACYALNDDVERFKARRIDPVHVFEDHQNRIPGRQSDKLRCQSFERLVLALLGHKLDAWISSVVREREHARQECCVLRRGRGLRKKSVEFVELCLRSIVV